MLNPEIVVNAKECAWLASVAPAQLTPDIKSGAIRQQRRTGGNRRQKLFNLSAVVAVGAANAMRRSGAPKKAATQAMRFLATMPPTELLQAVQSGRRFLVATFDQAMLLSPDDAKAVYPTLPPTAGVCAMMDLQQALSNLERRLKFMAESEAPQEETIDAVRAE